jgi:tetratricopeptide (TPR) repeat protein
MNRRDLTLEQMQAEQLAAAPRDAEAMHTLARACLESGKFDDSVGWASLAIKTEPRPDYLSTLGAALSALGRRDEAIQAFDKAVQLKPDESGLWRQMGAALVDAERTGDALLCFQHALALDPGDGESAYRAGALLRESGRFDEALACFDRSARLRPDHAPTFAKRGSVRGSLKRYEQAIDDYEVAIRLDPNDVETCCNMGNAFRALGRLDNALAWYDRSLALATHIGVAINRALTLLDLGRFLEARAAYLRAMSIDSKDPLLIWNLSLFQLLLGDFEAGWRGREARWEAGVTHGYPRLDTPMWIGEEAIAGKTVVVCQDEGVGDVIQFARYIPMLAARGARVILAVNQELCRLLSRLDGVSHCLPRKEGMVVPPFDFHVAIDSLPLAFGTRLDTIPAGRDYLPPPEPDRVQAWDDRLGRHDRLRVGLVWSGNPRHGNDHNRSLSLQTLSKILDVDAAFVSLQKNPRPDDAETLRQREDIVDHTAELTDFAETAALVSCLDLVITVDTSVAHLAGALGRPTWILLPYVPDWRWLLGRDDSPWYPTVRLFRQDETRDYGGVLDRMRAELRILADRRRA